MLQLQLVCCGWRPSTSYRPLRPTRRGGRTRPPALGVPGFSTWIDVQFATSRGHVPEGFSADVVAFDLNSLLHSQLRKAHDEPHAIKLTFRALHQALRCVRPETTVLLAIDGSGPMAKMATQQSRRRKTATKRAFADARGLSPLLLTPGTQFMERLEEALVYWICSELSTARGRHLRILLSGSDAPGEGEFKIMDWLLEQSEAGGRAAPRSAVLVGGDGDLVLQALSLCS